MELTTEEGEGGYGRFYSVLGFNLRTTIPQLLLGVRSFLNLKLRNSGISSLHEFLSSKLDLVAATPR
jgi:hypothetical protein